MKSIKIYEANDEMLKSNTQHLSIVSASRKLDYDFRVDKKLKWCVNIF